MENEKKQCKKCGLEKSVVEFNPEPRTKSGVSGSCRDCLRQYRAEWGRSNSGRVQASRQKWRENNPDKVAESRRRQDEKKSHKRKECRIERGIPLLQPRYKGDERKCSACHKYKSVDEFYQSANAKDTLAAYCKPCAARKAREHRKQETAEQREQRRIYMKKYDLERLYGETIEQLQARLGSQSGRCAICSVGIDLMAQRHSGRTACVDHDHSTGAIRGMLCVKCNAGLGQFCDSEDFLMNARSYLRRHKNRPQ